MKDQFVIVCVESAESAAVVLPWARHLAERLRHKGLMLLHVTQQPTDDSWLKETGVPYVSMRGDWSTAIEGLPTAFNGILAVTAVDPKAPRTSLTHPKTLLREFKNCKIAYLCVNVDSLKSSRNNVSSYQRINVSTLTLTHRREGKEKLVWASYLARFVGATVTIAHPNYRDPGLRQRCANNLRFADKIFKPLNIEYNLSTLHSPLSTFHTPDLAALDELQPDLLIARTTDTRDRDLVDWLLPPPELRLLTHPSRTPLLFLNPRDDLYILCD